MDEESSASGDFCGSHVDRCVRADEHKSFKQRLDHHDWRRDNDNAVSRRDRRLVFDADDG